MDSTAKPVFRLNYNKFFSCGYSDLVQNYCFNNVQSEKVKNSFLNNRSKIFFSWQQQLLKVHLHEISASVFFISKASTRSPVSYPKFVLVIKSNSLKYLNYSSLCVDSVNVELIFCFKLHTNFQHFMVDIGPNLNISWLIFLYPIPLKTPEIVMYGCFGLIHLSHSESMRNETSRQLSQQGVRLHINWVNAEWDSTSTASTQKALTFTKISSFSFESVDVESKSVLTQSTWSLTWRWLSWRGMRFGFNRVTSECYKIRISRRIQVQNRKDSKALLFGLYMFDECKKPEQKISCKCTFKNHYQ